MSETINGAIFSDDASSLRFDCDFQFEIEDLYQYLGCVIKNGRTDFRIHLYHGYIHSIYYSPESNIYVVIMGLIWLDNKFSDYVRDYIIRAKTDLSIPASMYGGMIFSSIPNKDGNKPKILQHFLQPSDDFYTEEVYDIMDELNIHFPD